ncbi:Glutamate 5-kinase / RNA-binding C-terminal domain PUA [hydrothermal vent metagenome]|uniref:Glutamate 5-kinase / RNA-binding C-terminal domain PUA n=1 Tax=hydrothermal vent metagenome TaxID=652676 RepID=A0A3B1AAR7_9ZZZZ
MGKTKRQQIGTYHRWVVKIGSALLTNNGEGVDHQAIDVWVAQLAALQRLGVEVILVSSGSVAEGVLRLGWETRPEMLHELQAAAAVGQVGLVHAYEKAFQRHGLCCAQILLTHDDLSNRTRYLNSRSTLNTLVASGVIPIINENDTVATDEICFGDNDTLAALVVNLLEADLLVILTDQQGMYDKDPRHHADAVLLSELSADDESLAAMAGGGGLLGRGGMLTKVGAAKLAARSGAATVIASGHQPNVLQGILSGEMLGTLLYPDSEPVNARKQWLAGHLQSRGSLSLDEGAVKTLKERGGSLLPIDVKAVTGDFRRGELVVFLDTNGLEIGRGLVNYSAGEALKIIGHPSGDIIGLLGYLDEVELIHQDNLVLS